MSGYIFQWRQTVSRHRRLSFFPLQTSTLYYSSRAGNIHYQEHGWKLFPSRSTVTVRRFIESEKGKPVKFQKWCLHFRPVCPSHGAQNSFICQGIFVGHGTHEHVCNLFTCSNPPLNSFIQRIFQYLTIWFRHQAATVLLLKF